MPNSGAAPGWPTARARASRLYEILVELPCPTAFSAAKHTSRIPTGKTQDAAGRAGRLADAGQLGETTAIGLRSTGLSRRADDSGVGLDEHQARRGDFWCRRAPLLPLAALAILTIYAADNKTKTAGRCAGSTSSAKADRLAQRVPRSHSSAR